MPESNLTVRVAKTIQERQYEPFTVEISLTVDTPASGEEYTNKQIRDAYTRLEQRVDSIIDARIKKATQDPIYGN